MKSKRRLFYSVLIVLFLIMFFGVCSNKESHYSVPDFTLTDIFGNDGNLYTILRKGPVLIVCWTPHELLQIYTIYRQYQQLLQLTERVKSFLITWVINQMTRSSSLTP